MAVLAAAAPYISMASTAFSFISSMNEASNQKSMAAAQQRIYDMQAQNAQTVANRNAMIVNDRAKYDAANLKIQGGQEQASGQRAAIEQSRRAGLMRSAAIAEAGGTGGGALDPTVLDIMGQIGEKGQYNYDTALYEGNAKANIDTNQATLDIFQGKQQSDMIKYGGASDASMLTYKGDVAKYEGAIQSQATQMKAFGGLFEGGMDIASKYAPKTYTDGQTDSVGSAINWNY